MAEEGFVQMYVHDFATLAARAEAGADVEAAVRKRVHETRSHAALMDSRKGGHGQQHRRGAGQKNGCFHDWVLHLGPLPWKTNDSRAQGFPPPATAGNGPGTVRAWRDDRRVGPGEG